jgi:PIN domain nuclease of toxin-antitoxin system
VILLDTHAFVWFVHDPAKLTSKARSLLTPKSRKAIAAITCWEIGLLVQKGRIAVDRGILDWIEDALEELQIDLLPLTPSVSVKAAELGHGFHGDPADRMIVATALQWNAIILTRDERIRDFSAVKTVW